MTAQQTRKSDRQEGLSTEAPERSASPLPDLGGLSRLGDIEVKAAVEVGAAELLLRDLAALGPGSVVRLDRLTGEPAELTVNGRLFARGDLVVVGDHLGLRITDLTNGGSAPREGK